MFGFLSDQTILPNDIAALPKNLKNFKLKEADICSSILETYKKFYPNMYSIMLDKLRSTSNKRSVNKVINIDYFFPGEPIESNSVF